VGAEETERFAARARRRMMLDVRFGARRYAIDTEWISKVEQHIELTRVPAVPPYVKGLVLVGGRVLAAIDILYLIGSGSLLPRGQVIIEIDDRALSLITEEVPGFIALQGVLEPARPEEPPFILGSARHEGEAITVIDARRLMSVLCGETDQKSPASAMDLDSYTLFEGSEAPSGCKECGGVGYTVAAADDVFSTVLGFVSTLTGGPGAPVALDAGAIRSLIERSLDSAQPANALERFVNADVKPGLRLKLISAVAARHFPACRSCAKAHDSRGSSGR